MGRAGTSANSARHGLSPVQHEPAMSTARHADTSGGVWATHEQHFKSLARARHEHDEPARKLARLLWLKLHNI